ncbi:MAG: alpha/beta fold hydrolase [Bryobacteraceae bacterium]|nr:alpha/beta fold hydrolase [Bryobacteraceae bacterium]
MAVFVLVHGAWHGAWSWDRVTPLLRVAGHTVLAPELPKTSLAANVAHLASAMAPHLQPAIVVGHSLAGITITALAEHVPERIARLVYLAAFLPKNGQSVTDLMGKGGAPFIDVSPDRRSLSLKPDRVAPVLYSDCPPGDINAILPLLTPEPAATSLARAATTEDRFGSVPRAYIECLNDQCIPLTLQRAMHGAMPCDPVLSLETGHCPNWSAPAKLAAMLCALA